MNSNSQPVWPQRAPVFRLIGMLLSLVLGLLFLRIWFVRSAAPLERFYFPTYLRLSLFGSFSLGHKQPKFQVVFSGRDPATSSSLEHVLDTLTIRQIGMKPHAFTAWLRLEIYGGKSPAQVLRMPLIGTGICFVLLVIGGAYLDRKHDVKARDGRLLRGPRLISRWRFNRLTKGNGLRFRLTNRRNLLEWFLGEQAKDLVIKRDREAHHIQIAGDTGSGKSTLVRQIVCQIAARNEVAIIFDPDREYIREFYREDRGDWVLNPKDDRCPYWPIGEECDDEAEATPIAIGLFPDEPTRQQFFVAHSGDLFVPSRHIQADRERARLLDGASRRNRQTRRWNRTRTHLNGQCGAAKSRYPGQPQRSREAASDDADSR